jgi:hypothetical protein
MFLFLVTLNGFLGLEKPEADLTLEEKFAVEIELFHGLRLSDAPLHPLMAHQRCLPFERLAASLALMPFVRRMHGGVLPQFLVGGESFGTERARKPFPLYITLVSTQAAVVFEHLSTLLALHLDVDDAMSAHT